MTSKKKETYRPIGVPVILTIFILGLLNIGIAILNGTQNMNNDNDFLAGWVPLNLIVGVMALIAFLIFIVSNRRNKRFAANLEYNTSPRSKK